MIPFRATLQLWQARRGWTDQQAADAIRVPRKTLRNWRQGVTDPPLAPALSLLMSLIDERDGLPPLAS